ncbi:MAG: ABC transporter permease [Nitrospinae bacterium]|nr:ABC transporter permease [Nitrospinota bacterium]
MLKLFILNVQTLLRYRELIGSLVGKELKARYRGSALGMLWTFLNPLLLLTVYALVFSVYMRVEMENYAVFMFAGLLPWIWFSTSLLDGVNSVVSSGDLITKSMFPAEILPMVKIVANLANYVFSLPLLIFFMFVYGIPLTAQVVWLPVLMVAQLTLTVGLVYFFAAMNVRFRDTQHVLGSALTLWFFVSPILYPASQVPEEYRFTFLLNPMAPMVMGYQNIFVHGTPPDFLAVGGVFLGGLIVSLFSVAWFERNKETFAEEI